MAEESAFVSAPDLGSIRFVSSPLPFSSASFDLSITSSLPVYSPHYHVRELSTSHLSVSLSSCKFSSGVSCLFDSDLNTFWQSDGQIPHTATISSFIRFQLFSLHFYVNHSLDESYTPQLVLLTVNNQEILQFELTQPIGWVNIRFTRALKAKSIGFSVVQSHQNGRDTHVRQLKLMAEKRQNRERKERNTNQTGETARIEEDNPASTSLNDQENSAAAALSPSAAAAEFGIMAVSADVFDDSMRQFAELR